MYRYSPIDIYIGVYIYTEREREKETSNVPVWRLRFVWIMIRKDGRNLNMYRTSEEKSSTKKCRVSAVFMLTSNMHVLCI